MRAASRPPELPRLSEDDLDASPVTVLQNDAFVIGAAVTGADLSGQRAESLSLTDVEFTRCNLANVQAPRARMSRVAISDSRLTGATLTESQLRDVTIRGCRADLTSFGFSRLERVTFEDCVLSGADFLEARLDSVRFNGCDLFEADIRGARLTACELRACRLDGLQGVANLAGAAMEWPAIVEMAGAWAAALGIEVLE